MGKDRVPRTDPDASAEGEGFEPSTGGNPVAVFKTAAIGRSAIPPAIGAPTHASLKQEREDRKGGRAVPVRGSSQPRLCWIRECVVHPAHFVKSR